MTVNTNGAKPVEYPEPGTPYVTDEAAILHDIRNEVSEIRASQLRTETLVKDFIDSMARNPMMGAMAKMIGGRK